jgi:hypothetical protein
LILVTSASAQKIFKNIEKSSKFCFFPRIFAIFPKFFAIFPQFENFPQILARTVLKIFAGCAIKIFRGSPFEILQGGR